VLQIALAGSTHVRPPPRSHVMYAAGAPSSKVDLDVKVTGAPATTGSGAHSNLAFGSATATPTPSGETRAPTVSRQAVSTLT
jgi:hypothetical protein